MPMMWSRHPTALPPCSIYQESTVNAVMEFITIQALFTNLLSLGNLQVTAWLVSRISHLTYWLAIPSQRYNYHWHNPTLFFFVGCFNDPDESECDIIHVLGTSTVVYIRYMMYLFGKRDVGIMLYLCAFSGLTYYIISRNGILLDRTCQFDSIIHHGHWSPACPSSGEMARVIQPHEQGQFWHLRTHDVQPSAHDLSDRSANWLNFRLGTGLGSRYGILKPKRYLGSGVYQAI